jgi:hypothetical protein
LLIFVLAGGVVFEGLAVDFEGAVYPGLVVLAEETVATHEETLEEAVVVHGFAHVLGAGGAVVAAGAIDGGEDLLVEGDDEIGEDHTDGAVGWGLLGLGDFEIMVSAPGLLENGPSEEGAGKEEKQEEFRSHAESLTQGRVLCH